MKSAYRLSAPLLVAGLALVVCGVRGSHAAPAEAATPIAHVPGVVSATASSHKPVRVTPGHPRHAHARDHRRATPSASRTSAAERTPPSAVAAAPAPEPAARPTAVTHPVGRAVSGPTPWRALNAAIARIPTYRSGAARWVVSSKYDFWGTADWYHDVLYVDPEVPSDKLYDVAVHEWSHELSVLDYGGDVAAATRAMDATFGGSGLTGPERAADCMSILQGATWTHYTTCTDAAWRAAAARLVAGHSL